MNIPNLLTWLRMVLVPVFVIVFYLPFSWSNEVTFALFAIAGITDWLDGYLARRWNQTSRFGAFLDPVADKLMVAVALILLVQQTPSVWVTIPAAIIIGREIAISALREWMAEIGQRSHVAVANIGKVKTTAQISSILLMLYHDDFMGIPVFDIGLVLLYVASFLTIWSMLSYIKAALPTLNADDEK